MDECEENKGGSKKIWKGILIWFWFTLIILFNIGWTLFIMVDLGWSGLILNDLKWSWLTSIDQNFRNMDHSRNFSFRTIPNISYSGPFLKLHIMDYSTNSIWTLVHDIHIIGHSKSFKRFKEWGGRASVNY